MKKVSLVSFAVIGVCLSSCKLEIAGKEVLSFLPPLNAPVDRNQASASSLPPEGEKKTKNKRGGLFSQSQPSPHSDAQPKVVSASSTNSNPSVKGGVKRKAEGVKLSSGGERGKGKGRGAGTTTRSGAGLQTRKKTSSRPLRPEAPPAPGMIWYYDENQGKWIQI